MSSGIAMRQSRPRLTALLVVAGVLAHPAWSSHAFSAEAAPARLRVAVKPIEPFVIIESGSVRGYSIDVWDSIAAELGRDTEYVPLTTVPEMLQMVADRSIGAAIAAITITAEREAAMDFSHPYFNAGLRVAVPAHLGPTWLSTLSRFLSRDILGMLGTLVGLTLLTANVLWLLERRVNPDCFPRSYLAGIGEATWWSVATIITGGCENKAPVSLPGRMVAVAWMLGSIVLVASFTATMSSQMTAESVTGAISGPESLPGRSVATVKGTAAVASLEELNARVVECDQLDAAFAATSSGRAEALVFDAPVLAYRIKKTEGCGVRLVGPTFEKQDYGIALPADSPLREPVNTALLTLSESGKLAEISRKWLGASE